jgi:hypothetical protein
MPRTPRLVSAAVLAAVLASVASADELSTLTGKRYAGKLDGIGDGVLTFAPAGGAAVRVPVKDVLAVDMGAKFDPTKAGKHDEIELVDGSVIRCTGFRVKGKAVEPALLPGAGGPPPKVELPLEALFAVMRGADDPKNRDDWRKLLAARGKRDLFVIRGQDGLNPLPGTVLGGDDAGESVRFERESDGRTVTFKLTRATGGLVFNQPPRGVIPPTVCRVIDGFGNTLTAREVAVADGGLAVTTVAGAKVLYPSLAAVAKLDFSQGNLAYLSDLEPKVDAPPAVPGEPYYAFARDRTNEGSPLRLDGVAYAKGLWVFPDTALTYTLGGDYREFKAVVGVDESVQVASSAVRLLIEADGRPLFNELVSRKDKPRPLTLDVKGAKTLTVRVEGQGLYLGNQVNLADARVQK